ncbi:MAG: arginine--tRNA ligase [Candidatus Nitrosocosmicus sp.]
MLYENIKQEIKDQIEKVLFLYNLNADEIKFDVSEPPIKEFGDFSCNVAFLISKVIKKNPYEIAKDIINHILSLNDKNKFESSFELISAERPGVINFKIDTNRFLKKFFSSLLNVTRIPQFGTLDKTILIEHTSVNPNKALHIGHVRNSILGDCLYRLLSQTGHNVKVLYYVDDSGLQVADIIVALRDAEIPTENYHKEKFDHYCGTYVYIKINDLYPTRPDLEIKRKQVLKNLEDPNSEVYLYTQQIVKRILTDQLATCWNLKCHYDVLNFESQIIQSKLWINIFKILKERQIIQLETTGENTGCWVFKSKKEGDKVLVRSDGTVTYFAKDIPYAIWKLGIVKNPFDFDFFSQQWDNTNLYETKIRDSTKEHKIFESEIINFKKIDKVITIIDFRQERLQSLLLEILNNLGIEKSKYKYLGYEPVTLSNKTAQLLGINSENKKSKSTQMSGRKGIFVEADSAIDMLIIKAYDEIRKRNDEIADNEARQIAKEIAISAIRYYIIKHDIGKSIVFDINNSLSLDGDTGPYIQYSYARGNRIFNKVKDRIDFLKDYEISNLHLDLVQIEIDLIKHLTKFSITIKESIDNQEPKLVANYLFLLSTLFNHFYERSPIIKEEDKLKKKARIEILRASLLIMHHCMSIIGITLLEKM